MPTVKHKPYTTLTEDGRIRCYSVDDTYTYKVVGLMDNIIYSSANLELIVAIYKDYYNLTS